MKVILALAVLTFLSLAHCKPIDGPSRRLSRKKRDICEYVNGHLSQFGDGTKCRVVTIKGSGLGHLSSLEADVVVIQVNNCNHEESEPTTEHLPVVSSWTTPTSQIFQTGSPSASTSQPLQTESWPTPSSNEVLQTGSESTPTTNKVVPYEEKWTGESSSAPPVSKTEQTGSNDLPAGGQFSTKIRRRRNPSPDHLTPVNGPEVMNRSPRYGSPGIGSIENLSVGSYNWFGGQGGAPGIGYIANYRERPTFWDRVWHPFSLGR